MERLSKDDEDAQNPGNTQQDSHRVRILTEDTSALIAIIDPDANIEILAEGFVWSEGPLWIDQQQQLLFSDVPQNKIFSWTEAGGVLPYLTPSGYTGDVERAGEPGSNGLALSRDGKRLYLCQHGDRRIAEMDASLSEPNANYLTIAETWNGKRFNSPNDLVVNSTGQIFFTDPPYGLEGQEGDPAKEIAFQGVFRLDPDGSTHLVTDALSRPNGIGLSPDERTLYVANSDPAKAIWMAYTLNDRGGIESERLFYDATSMVKTHQGLPDGLKVNKNGIVFATGPGGVWIFNPEGKPLGRIETGEATANCALNTDGTVLFMCADDYLMRVALKA
jgi:gluconolactonase